MLLAHVCGLTKVSTFMFANADSWQYYPFAGFNEEHHGTSHMTDPASIEGLDRDQHLAQDAQINYMLGKLLPRRRSPARLETCSTTRFCVGATKASESATLTTKRRISLAARGWR